MYIVVGVYFSHMPVIFAVVSMLRVDCKCQAKSNVHLTESQIKTVKARTKPKLWTGVPLIEVSAVKRVNCITFKKENSTCCSVLLIGQ